MARVTQQREAQETEMNTATQPEALAVPDLHYLCRAYGTYFPGEDALRPLEDWSYNPVTLEPLRTYCKRCDAKKKSRYTAKKKATKGPLVAEHIRELLEKGRESLADPTAWTRDDDPMAVRARAHIASLEGQLARMGGE